MYKINKLRHVCHFAIAIMLPTGRVSLLDDQYI